MGRILASFLLLGGPALAQSARPRFETASIKPSGDPASGSSSSYSGNGRLTMSNVTLKRMILGAWGLRPSLLVGGPPWLDEARFDIVAKAETRASDREVMVMLRSLLAERFQLTTHWEKRTLPAFVIEVGKDGPKLERAETDQSSSSTGRGKMEAKAFTMARFAEDLSREVDLPVVDRTGLEGRFNLKLRWTTDEERAAGTGTGPSLGTALAEQLGLRLRSEKVPLDVMVIDRAERPSEN